MAVTVRLSTGATLTWNSASIGKFRDFGIEVECDPKDVTAQGDGGHRDYIAGLRHVFINTTLIWDQQDTGHDGLYDDWSAGTARTLTLVTPDGTSKSYTAVITDLSQPAPLGEVVMANVTFEVNDAATISAAGN